MSAAGVSLRHANAGHDLAQQLGVDPRCGLDNREVARRRAEQGPNRIPEPPPVSRWLLLAAQFRNGMVALLGGAAVIALAFGEMTEAALILAIVVANAGLGYVQESRAEAATRALRTLLSARARVLRCGQVRSIPADELVTGDIVLLQAGDRVPADGWLVDSTWLEVDESILTGESLPAVKDATAEPSEDGPLAERPTMTFAGTTVAHGTARAVIRAIGTHTEVGRIASSVPSAPARTPLQLRLDRLANTLLRASVACGIVLGALAWAYGDPLDQAVLVAVALAVAVVPEGLPAVVTITLALGMKRMATRGAIVRRLHAVETLGSTTVICSDKTGTLTENRMTVVGCAGGAPDPVLAAAWLASDADPQQDSSPEERAIADAARARGLDHRRLLGDARVVEVEPFDPATRTMTVVIDDPRDGPVAYVKGAPEALLDSVIEPSRREELGDTVRRSTAAGRRVLLVAKAVPGAVELDGIGLVLLSDPPRTTAADSIRLARAAGVRTMMITGDHPATALAVAHEVGLTDHDRDGVMTGAEIDTLTDDELGPRLRMTSVIARVEPRHKLRVVRTLEDSGEVVAMTGDGVNDVPALAAAHIGVAMGARGADAAIDASDMVLTDDDYSTIVRAIALGRAIHDNIARFVHFLLATNAGAMLLFALAIPLGLGAPLTVPQILVVNLLTDGLPAVALGLDPPARDVMDRAPRPPREGLLDPLRGRLGLAGLTTGLVCLAALLLGQADSEQTGTTMVFATLVGAKLLYVFSVRGDEAPWRAGWNWFLVAAVALSAALGASVLVVEPLRTIFDTAALSAGQIATVAALSTLPLIAGEAQKWLMRRRRAARYL
jgi:Ca2+-transporting ATPase